MKVLWAQVYLAAIGLALLWLGRGDPSWQDDGVRSRPAVPDRPAVGRAEQLWHCPSSQELAVTLRTTTGRYVVEPAVAGRRSIHIQRTRGAPEVPAAEEAQGAKPDLLHRRDTPHPELFKQLATLPGQERFLAAPQTERVVDWFADLRAERALGKVKTAALSAFGLPAGHMGWGGELVLRCGALRFVGDLGQRPYGTTLRYLRRRDTGEVWLVDAAPLQLLRSAHFQLMDTRLLPQRIGQADALWVRSGRRELRLSLVAASPLPASLNRWLRALSRLRVLAYLQWDTARTRAMRAEAQVSGTVLELQYLAGEATLARAEVLTVEQDGGVRYFARSSHSVSWVELTAASALPVLDGIPLSSGEVGSGAH